MKPSRVLLISPLPPPAGGIATWSAYMLDFFKNNKEIDLYHLNAAIKGRMLSDVSMLSRLYYGIKNIFNNIFLLLIHLIKVKPKVVHITSSASLGLLRDLLFLLIIKLFNKRSIIHFRFGRIPELASKKNWEWYLLQFVIYLSSKTIVLDKRSFNILNKKLSSKIELLPNPISDTVIETSNKLEKRTEQIKGKVLFVGHVIKAKGVIELAKAASQIDQVTELHLVGPIEESMKLKLQVICKERSKSWLHIHNELNKDEVYYHMQTCNLFVLPSYTEGFPNVILEAMAFSCPIVSTHVGAIPEMLSYNTSQTNICIPPKDIVLLKNSIQNIILDHALAEHLGQLAKKKVIDDYSLKQIGQQLITIWKT